MAAATKPEHITSRTLCRPRSRRNHARRDVQEALQANRSGMAGANTTKGGINANLPKLQTRGGADQMESRTSKEGKMQMRIDQGPSALGVLPPHVRPGDQKSQVSLSGMRLPVDGQEWCDRCGAEVSGVRCSNCGWCLRCG